MNRLSNNIRSENYAIRDIRSVLWKKQSLQRLYCYGGSGVNSSSNTKTDTPNDGTPPTSVVEGLVKDTIDQFSEAVSTGDFSDLRSNASTDFQSTYTVDQMASAFKSYTDKKRLVVPLLEKVDGLSADFKQPPSIRTEKGLKILMAEGEFKTKPSKVLYDFEYVNRGGEWKLLKLVINIP